MMIKTILLQSPDTFVQRLDTQVWSTSINAFVSYPVNQRTETHTHTDTHTGWSQYLLRRLRGHQVGYGN